MVMLARFRITRPYALGIGAAVVTLLGVAAGLDGLSTFTRMSLLSLSAVFAGTVAVLEATGRRRENERTAAAGTVGRRNVRSDSLYQLPRDLTDFTGRQAEVARAVAFLEQSTGHEAVPIAVIAGKGGIGKPDPGIWHSSAVSAFAACSRSRPVTTAPPR